MKNIIILLLFLATSKFAIAELSEDALGKNKGYPSCQFHQPVPEECKVGTLSNPYSKNNIFDISIVKPAQDTKKIKYINEEKANEVKGKLNIDRYLSKQRATGLMIIKNNEVVVEKYQYERKSDVPFASYSMAKSITSILIGIAFEKGYINSLDDKAEMYLPEILGTAYGETTIRNFLRMSSGVEFNEIYGNTVGDLNKFFGTLDFKPSGKYAISTNAKLFNKRRYKQGERFYYSSADTEFLARIVVSATKKSMTQLTHEWIWNPIGAEDSAYWLVFKSDNVESGSGGFYATLRDYAKFAMMLANDGLVDGEQIVSKKYLMEATDSDLQPSGFKKGQAQWKFGYGYQFWILPMKERTFAMQGIYGQNIFIQPSSKTIMIQTSVYERASEDPSWDMQTDLFKEAIKLLGGNPF